MDTFLKALETEIQTQKNLIHKNKAFLRDAPSGSLFRLFEKVNVRLQF